MSVFVADFESTTDIDDCRVWLWGVMHIVSEAWEYGLSIGSFFEYVRRLDPSTIWLHNLAFDGSFILDYLLKHGFKYNASNKLVDGEFTCLISKMNKFYSIKVRIGDTDIIFKDSLKKLPMSIRKIGETYDIEVEKGEIDYRKYRPVGYIPTHEELDYLESDLLVACRALRLQLNDGHDSITIGADALKEFTDIIGGRKAFRAAFPLLDPYIDGEIRKAYRGGWTYVNELFQGRVVGSGKVYDVNSLYPHVMYSCPLPYGEPTYFQGEPPSDGSLWIASVSFGALIKPDHLPCIQIKGSFGFAPTEYLTEIESVTMVVTSVDWELWNEQYDVQVECWNTGFMFKSKVGMFKKYIDKWSEIKRNSKGGKREIAKLFLNSLYGKFATNPDVTGRVPVLENGVVKLALGDYEERDPVYTPMGVFITAFARGITVRAAQENYWRFAYADTDSLHLVGNGPVDLDIDDSRFGAWKIESVFSMSYFMRAKAYYEENWVPTYHRKIWKRERSVRIAGVPRDLTDSITINDFIYGCVIEGKLLPKRVSGGIVLVESTFNLRG